MRLLPAVLAATLCWVGESPAAIRKAPGERATDRAPVDAAVELDRLDNLVRGAKVKVQLLRLQLEAIRERDKIVDPDPENLGVLKPPDQKLPELQSYLERKLVFLKAKERLAQAQADLETAQEKRVVQLEASLAAAKKMAQDTYTAAAKLRQLAKIIDPDPDGEAIAVAEFPEDAPMVEGYAALKQEYLKAKAKAKQAQQALNAALEERKRAVEDK